MRPLSVYDIRGGGRRGRRTSRPRSCRRRGTPTAPATPASESVRVSSVSAGTVESGVEHDPAVVRLELVRRRRAARAAGRRAKPRGSRSRRSPARRRSATELDAEAALALGLRERLVPRGARRDRTAPTARGASPRAARRRARGTPARPRFEKNGRGTLSGRRSGSRRRTETTSAPAASAFSHSVAAAMPGADDRDPRRVLVRLVGVHGARVVGGRARPGWPGRDEHVRERPFAVELEAAVDGARSARPAAARSSGSQPLRSRTSLGVREEVLDARVVAVRDGRDERPQRAGALRLAHREPRERRGGEVPVGLRAHPPLADRRRAPAPRPRSGPRASRRPRSRPGRARRAAASRSAASAASPLPTIAHRAPVHATSPSRRAGPARSSAGTRRTRPAG